MNPSSMPQITIPRSKWLQEFTHSTSWLHGDLIPLDCFEVLPGDDYSVRKAALEVIMSTPIAPIMGNIKQKVCAFFVPMRLLYDKTEEFFGANKTSAGPQNTTYLIPSRSVFRDNIVARSLSHYLGKPIVSQDNSKTSYGWASVLKERGYYFIWSEWYRAQQLQDPFIMITSYGTAGNANIGNIGGSGRTFGSLPMKVCKQVDMFTAATLSPQYGAAVELPLGSYAPIKWSADNVSFPTLNTSNQNPIAPTISSLGQLSGDKFHLLDTDGTALTGADIKYIADLSTATAAKINDIRYAFQLQKYLERANFGTRFFEVLAVHYGVSSPDARLQRPEYLGGKSCPISIRSVLSQADYTDTSATKVGKMGAVSQTFIDISGLFSKGFVEPGYVYILASNNHERLYSQGLMREDTKFDRFEFYSPEFNNLGDQAILNKEIMLTGDASDEQVFGYQGHWDEYRYRKNRVSGLLDPLSTGALKYWTLAEEFTTRPQLSASFIEESRDCLSRCLVTGNNGPDYICDCYIQYAATREMSMYAIPGLIDHFGAL